MGGPGVYNPSQPGFTPAGGPGVYHPSQPGFTPAGGPGVYHPSQPGFKPAVDSVQREVNQVLLEEAFAQQRDRLVAQLDKTLASNARIGAALHKNSNQDPSTGL